MVVVTAIVGLEVSESSINTNFVHLKDPRAAAHMLPLPRYFGQGIPLMRELRPGSVVLAPAFIQQSMVGHGDPDDPRAYLAVEVALPAPAPTSGSGGDPSSDPSSDPAGMWSTPVLHVPAAVSPGSALLARLLPAIMAMEGRNGSVYKSNKGGWQSVPDLLDHRWSVPALAELEAVLHTGISAFLQRGGAGSVLEREATGAVLDTEIHEAWVGINRPGNSNTVHLHPGSHISGVFYVSVPGGGGGGASGGRLTLHDPRGPVSPSWGGPFSLDPGDGDLVVFPSWLEHHVEPHRDPRGLGQPRVIVSFNAKVSQRYGGFDLLFWGCYFGWA